MFSLGIFFLASLFLGIAHFSWATLLVEKHGSFDPYLYIGRDRSLLRVVFGALFQPLQFAVLAILFLFPLAFLLRHGWKNRQIKVASQKLVSLATDRALLFFLALTVLTQVILIRQSLNRSYWLVQRQWIAGFPLAMIFFAIFLRLFLDGWSAERFRRLSSRLVMAMVVALSLVYGYRLYRNWQAPASGSAYTQAEFEQALAEKRVEQFEALAHHNLIIGGPVHPGFAYYYQRSAPSP